VGHALEGVRLRRLAGHDSRPAAGVHAGLSVGPAWNGNRGNRGKEQNIAEMKQLFGLTMAVVLTFTACKSEEQRLREVRSDWRKFNLPLALENDELQVGNDQLLLDICRKSGECCPNDVGTDGTVHGGPLRRCRSDAQRARARSDGLSRLQVDKVVAEYTKKAIELSDKISSATRDDWARLSDLDQRLDKIVNICRSRAQAAKTVKDAHAACSDLDSAYQQLFRRNE